MQSAQNKSTPSFAYRPIILIAAAVMFIGLGMPTTSALRSAHALCAEPTAGFLGSWTNVNPNASVRTVDIVFICNDVLLCPDDGSGCETAAPTSYMARMTYTCGNEICQSKNQPFYPGGSGDVYGSYGIKFANSEGSYVVQIVERGDRAGQLLMFWNVRWTDNSGRKDFGETDYFTGGRRGREPLGPGMLNNVDLFGADYADFRISRAEPALCEQACNRDGTCKAWTYFRTRGGSGGHCWLKNRVPERTFNRNTISGIKSQTVSAPSQPASRPTRNVLPVTTDRACSASGAGLNNFCIESAYPAPRGGTAYVVWRIGNFKYGEFDRGDGRGFVGPINAQMRVEVPGLTETRTIRLRWFDLNGNEYVDSLLIPITDQAAQPLPQPPLQASTVDTFPCSRAGINASNLCVLQPYPVKRGATATVVWRIASFSYGEFDSGDGRGLVGPITAEMRIDVPNVSAPRTVRLKWIDASGRENVDSFTIQVVE